MNEDIPKLKIFYFSQDLFGCGWYRCHVPGVALRDLGGHEVVMDEIITPEIVQDFDVIVFQRRLDEGSLRAIQDANLLKKLTVYELDDNVFHIDPKSPAFAFWSKPEHQKGVVVSMRACKLVTTSTNNLAQVFKPINSNVVVLKNMLPEKFFQVEKESHPGKVVIGWAGGAQHYSDLVLIQGVIEAVLDMYPQVEVVLAGMPAHAYPFQINPRIHILDWQRVEEYPKNTLAKIDIGLAPLVDNQFNRCKSDLKFIEYGMLKIPIIASPVGPYLESIEHKKTGFLAKTPKDWLKYLKRLIEDEDYRKEIAEAAYQVASKRTIEKNYHLWEEVYWRNLKEVRGIN